MGRRAGLVGGLRYEHTEVESLGIVAQPTAIEWQSDNDFRRLVGNSTVTIRRTGEYDNLLPSVDFQIEPSRNLTARVSYSKTLARPDYANLFVSEQANPPNRPTAIGGVATGNSGNPGLRPLVSDNFDVSLEWYFARSSYVSAGFFAKKVKNFVGQGQFTRNLFGLRDPSSGAPGSRSGTAKTELQGLGADITDVNLFTMTALLIQNGGNVAAARNQFLANFSNGSLNQGFVDSIIQQVDIQADANDPLLQFSVAEPINNRTGNIHGFEIQGQYFLGNTGFGIAGSYTKVNGDVHFNVGADPNENQFALLGLSDSFNVTAIYDKNGISARLAYNWRAKYLAQVNRGASRNPVFVAPFGTLDLDISYDVTDRLALSFEAINITSEPLRTYGRDKSNLWFAQELKPRLLLGARYRF
jgi:TonB-dependent receptor